MNALLQLLLSGFVHEECSYKEFWYFSDMDKEDALVCFQDHIKLLEQEYDDEKEREKRALKRRQRKHREAFLVCLHASLHLKYSVYCNIGLHRL